MKNNKKNKKRKSLKDLKIILQYFKPYKVKVIFVSIGILLISILNSFCGYLNGSAVEYITKYDIKNAIIFLLIYFVCEMIDAIVGRKFYYIIDKIQIKVANKMGYDTYKKAMKLPSYAFEDLSSGEIINRITNDTSTIVGNMDSLIDLISRFITSFYILIYIFFNSWIIGLEILIFLLIFTFIVRYFSKEIKKYHKLGKEENDKYTSIANESIRGIREIKTLGIINNLNKLVKNIIDRYQNANINETKVNSTYDIITSFLGSILEVGSFITCAILVYKGYVTITFFIAMTYYIYRYIYLIQNITNFTKTYERLMTSVERVSEILTNKLYQDVTYGEKVLENANGIIEFKNVTFNYKGEKELLNDFNIKFEPNKKIAIIGASGEGKSTLFNLITRIFDPVKGTITLDGIDIKDLNEESLRNNISIIRQEPFIFNRTIYENFKLLDESVDLDTVKKYCKIACIDEYIESLPKGYDTLLGEGGVNLSGGQKQRLSIARTLLKKSKVVLFDEATSALDNESQNYIKKSIDELAKNHTVLIVAHRLSTIIDADIIYIIRNGKVYASGTHDELIKNNSYYQKLYLSEQ